MAPPLTNVANLHLMKKFRDENSNPTHSMDGAGHGYSLIPDNDQTGTSFSPLVMPESVEMSQQTKNGSFDVFSHLVAAVDKNELNIYETGQAIHHGYSVEDRTVPDQVRTFVEKYAHRVSSSKMPPVTPFCDQDYLYIITHGYGLVSQLALVAANKPKVKCDADGMDLGTITGAICNVPATLVYNYPSEAPFSGEQIEIRVEMPRKMNLAPHVLIKKLIFTWLARSCTIPSDINSIVWALPEDPAGTRTSNPTPFPRLLYDNIKSILLHFFQLEEELLSRGTYDEESCKQLRCLQGLNDQNSRKKRYAVLHRARSTFMNNTYHQQFKAALYDLKSSTYIPPVAGERFGTFKLNSHAKRARPNDENDASSFG